ncbi:hypothetical protein pb186bvf_006114 [Paramecium bursaria]
MFLFIIQLICVQSIEFQFTLPKRDIRCFGDSVTTDEEIFIQTNSNIRDYSLKINVRKISNLQNPMRLTKEGFMHQSQDEFEQMAKFRPKYNHNIQVCIHNKNINEAQFTFLYKKNGSPPTLDLQPLQQSILVMKQLLFTIRNQLEQANDKFILKASIAQTLSYKTIMLSIATMGLSIIITFIVVYKYKRFAKQKKLI